MKRATPGYCSTAWLAVQSVDDGETALLPLWNKYKVHCHQAVLRTECDVAYESKAEPIKLGYLFDFRLPPGFPQEMREDLTRPFEMVFLEGLEQGLIDRPV